jgi:hypothetical protein
MADENKDTQGVDCSALLGDTPTSSTSTLIAVLRELAATVQCDDGVANAALSEAADRMDDMQDVIAGLVSTQAVVHMGGKHIRYKTAWPAGHLIHRKIEIAVT